MRIPFACQGETENFTRTAITSTPSMRIMGVSTVTVEMDDQHIGYAHNLDFKVGQVNTSVETFVWWRSGWLLHVHRIDASQPVVLRPEAWRFRTPAPPASERRRVLSPRCGRTKAAGLPFSYFAPT